MSRFLLPISRNWIGEEFYGSKYALHVASPHAVSPFVYAKCLLFACGATPSCPGAAAYANSFIMALRNGAVDGDLVQYIEHFDRSALGPSPGLRRKDENELKIVRIMSSMQHRTILYDALKAAVFLRAQQNSKELVEQLRATTTASDISSADAAHKSAAQHPAHSVSSSRGPYNRGPASRHQSYSQQLFSSLKESALTDDRQRQRFSTGLRLPLAVGRVRGKQRPAASAESGSDGAPSPPSSAQDNAAAASSTAAPPASATPDRVAGSGGTTPPTSAGCYDNNLCQVFTADEVGDVDMLSRELGLTPDIVIKSFEVCVRERDLLQRKRALFSCFMK